LVYFLAHFKNNLALIEGLSYREETGKLPYPKNLNFITERESEVFVGDVKDDLEFSCSNALL